MAERCCYGLPVCFKKHCSYREERERIAAGYTLGGMDDQKFYETLIKAMYGAARECGMVLDVERDLVKRRIEIRWRGKDDELGAKRERVEVHDLTPD